MINNNQQEKLKQLLINLKTSNLYFSNLFSGFSEKQINDDVETVYISIAPIRKKDIMENIINYVNLDLRACLLHENGFMNQLMETNTLSGNHDKILFSKSGKKWFMETTTGSTGKPFPVIKSYKERLIEANYLYSCRRHIFKQANVSNGFLMIHQTDPFLKQFNYRDGTTKNFECLVDYLLKKRPSWIFATALLFKKFTDYLLSTSKADLSELNIKFIELTSQTLLPEEKKNFEEYYKSRIINNFGCREIWNIAYECPLGHLHVNDSYIIVDLVNEKGELITENNEVGEVILTNLTNTTMPFIKYYLGDLARFSGEVCLCGCKSPVIIFEDGRYYEKLINTMYYGNVIFRKILRTLYFHDNINDINKIKIFQDEPYHISIFIDKNQKYDCFFERRFVELCKLTVENFFEFQVNFYYHYPFDDSKDILKEQIFINYLRER